MSIYSSWVSYAGSRAENGVKKGEVRNDLPSFLGLGNKNEFSPEYCVFQVEIKVYKQKVKHLLYEHQNNITELKTESEYDWCSSFRHRQEVGSDKNPLQK